MPATGGGATTTMKASLMAAYLANSARWMAGAERLALPARFSNGSRITKIAPAFGALVKVAAEKPTSENACPTPGVSSARSMPRRISSSVRASEEPGGSCAHHDQIGTVLLRDEALRGSCGIR